jgi:hypothetical protein
MLTQLLDEERATNASMSAVRATMQEHGLSISDILLLHSQNQFLQSELQVCIMLQQRSPATACSLARHAAIPRITRRSGGHHGQANGADQGPAGALPRRAPLAACFVLTPVLLQLQASYVKTNVDAQVCDV